MWYASPAGASTPGMVKAEAIEMTTQTQPTIYSNTPCGQCPHERGSHPDGRRCDRAGCGCPAFMVPAPKGDGDPRFPGGIGCPGCDTLWASSASLDKHLLDVHHATYEYLSGGKQHPAGPYDPTSEPTPTYYAIVTEDLVYGPYDEQALIEACLEEMRSNGEEPGDTPMTVDEAIGFLGDCELVVKEMDSSRLSHYVLANAVGR